jgi:hypothetical protein
MLNGLAPRDGFEAAPKVRKNRFECSATIQYLAPFATPVRLSDVDVYQNMILSATKITNITTAQTVGF